MRVSPRRAIVVVIMAALLCGGCSAESGAPEPGAASPTGPGGTAIDAGNDASLGDAGPPPTHVTATDDGPSAGNPDGHCAVPAEAAAEDVSHPRTVVGDGTPASCTGAAFVSAVAKGGVITFDCGDAPVTITLTQTAKIVNDTGPKIVIDGGNKVTLSGGGKVRILYQNACDEAQVWTSSNCNDQPDPMLTVQNLTFVDGNAKGLESGDNEGGGGAIYVRGGRLKIVHSRFFRDVCDDLGSDVGGGAVRVLDFPSGGSVSRPVFVVDSTFGGASGFGNTCANGGAISSIGASYTIIESLFSDNHAIGHGANDGQGGNGGAIYNDGNTFHLDLCGVHIEDNHANEGGSAIFFVSNDRTGSLSITDSVLENNPRGTFETPGFPGIYVLASGPPTVTNSTLK
jgi:hypothetical protein